MYKKIFNTVAKVFGLKVEVMKLYRPMGAEFWSYSKISNMVYQIYVSKSSKKKQNGFGFWVHDENLLRAYKKALEKVIPNLKWLYKNKLNKWPKEK
jgi:hypothetical protein